MSENSIQKTKKRQEDNVNNGKKGHPFLTCHRVNLINVRTINTENKNLSK